MVIDRAEDRGRLNDSLETALKLADGVAILYPETGRPCPPARFGPAAELLTQKHGKTLFFRDFLHHLKHSTDSFIVAPGIKGLVMTVFTLPSFPYVFKVIRDEIAVSKDTTREKVKEKYVLVKHHDRVGRMEFLLGLRRHGAGEEPADMGEQRDPTIRARRAQRHQATWSRRDRQLRERAAHAEAGDADGA